MQPIFYGTLTPLLTWFTVKKLIIDPYEQRKKATEKQNIKEANLLRYAKNSLIWNNVVRWENSKTLLKLVYYKFCYILNLTIRVAESRKEAMASIDLMLERFRRIRSEEATRNGLLIVAAVYGKIIEGMKRLTKGNQFVHCSFKKLVVWLFLEVKVI